MDKTKKRRTNQERREGSIEAIEKEAARLFVENGYRSTSIELIARSVSMTKGSVYFYFRDKETLLLRLLAKSEEHFFSQIFNSMDGWAGDPVKQIEVFLDQIIRAGVEVDKHLLLLPVLMSTEFKGTEEKVEQHAFAIYEHAYEKLDAIISAGQASGSFANLGSSRALATIIVALTDGLLLEIYRDLSGVSGAVIGKSAKASVEALLEVSSTNSAK